MAETISNIERLKEYFNGVTDRASHHANNVNEIVYPLVGAVISVATDDVEVRTRNGSLANTMWFVVGERRYALKYNHGSQTIDLLERTEQGALIHSFTNADSIANVKRIFSTL